MTLAPPAPWTLLLVRWLSVTRCASLVQEPGTGTGQAWPAARMGTFVSVGRACPLVAASSLSERERYR